MLQIYIPPEDSPTSREVLELDHAGFTLLTGPLSESTTRFQALENQTGNQFVLHRFPFRAVCNSQALLERAWRFGSSGHRPTTRLSTRWEAASGQWFAEDIEGLTTLRQMVEKQNLDRAASLNLGWAVHRALKRCERMGLKIESLSSGDIFVDQKHRGGLHPFRIRLRSLPMSGKTGHSFYNLMAWILGDQTANVGDSGSDEKQRLALLRSLEASVRGGWNNSSVIVPIPTNPDARASFLN